jgi:hypothetical protein
VTTAPPPGRPHRLALGLAIAAVAAPLLYFAFFPILAIAVAGAVVAIVLSVRALARGDRRPVVGWTLALAAIGAIVDTVLVIVAAVLLWGPSTDQVEVRAAGSEFTVEFEDDVQAWEVDWDGDGWSMRYATERSWAELTVTRADDARGPVECSILWNDVVVVEESSDSGQVTCRYDR